MKESHINYEYIAFISYKREDEKWAKWLQRKLEYYKLPSSVRKDNPNLPEKIRPVFKDTTDLEPGVLAQKIQNALNNSNFLIVICSPRSANSVWVSKEVQSFIDSGRADHIIPFIIGGIPNAADPKDECFPEGLRQLAGEQELLGANINEMGRDAAAIKVVARMFNLRFDTLWQRFERIRKRNKLISIFVTAASIVVAVSMLYLYIDRGIAYENLEIANREITQERNRVKKAQAATELSNQHLSQANQKIMQGNLQLKYANDSIHIVNTALIVAQQNLANKNKALEQANHNILKKQSDLIAAQILSVAESGDIPCAISLIKENYSSQENNTRLPVTSKSENAIRHVKSLFYQCDFVHFNSIAEIPMSSILAESQDILTGFRDGNIVKYRLNDSQIISTIPCQEYNNIPSEVEFAGFLDLSKTKLGITTTDSIYIYCTNNGKLIHKYPYHYIGGFEALNDSVILIANLFGNIDQIDSRIFKKINTTNIADFNPIFPEAFKINNKGQIVYVDSSQHILCRDIETGDTIWQKQFDYTIADEICLLDEINAVAVINIQDCVVELWSTENWEIITHWQVPTSSKYQMYSSGACSISLLTSGNINSKYDRWILPYQKFVEFFKPGKIYDSKLNYYVDKDSLCLYVADDSVIYLFQRVVNDGFSIIKAHDNGILSTCKIENSFRLIYFDYSEKNPNVHLISSNFGNNLDDWQDGYASFMYRHLPKSMRSLTFRFPFARWNQSTDISHDGRFIAAALFNNLIIVKDLKNGESYSFETSENIFSIMFSPNGENIIVTSDSGVSIYPIELDSFSKLINSIQTTRQRPCLAALSPNNDLMAVGYMNGEIVFYSYPEMKVKNISQLQSHIVYFTFNKTGSRLAVILDSNELIVCDTMNGQTIYQDKIPFDASNVIFDESDNKIIVHSDNDSMIYPFENIEFVINNIN